MPTYQYACTACDERLEAVQSFTDAPLTQCPVCDGSLRKVFSAVGVVFKGSGFYKNDSRDSGKKATAPKVDAPTATTSESSSSSAAPSASTSSSDSKPAATPKSTPAATPTSKTA